MYGAKFYDKPRDPLYVADIAGASPMVARRQLTNDPRVSLETTSSPPTGRWLSEGRILNPCNPAYQLPSFRLAEYGPPRSITEQMATREKQWALEAPPRERREPSSRMDYADVNEPSPSRRFLRTSATRPQPQPAHDVANVKPSYRSLAPRGTNPLDPHYTGLSGKPIVSDSTRVVPYGSRHGRAEGENYSLRTDDIDRCFADAFSQKYGAILLRPSNRVDDIFGAQHDTKCREPQVWRSSGPYVDPRNRHYPEALPSKRTNRVEDIAGAQTAKSRQPKPARLFHEARAAEALESQTVVAARPHTDREASEH